MPLLTKENHCARRHRPDLSNRVGRSIRAGNVVDCLLGDEMKYFAPSLEWGVHDDWGLKDHAALQVRIIPDGTWQSADLDVCREIVGDRFPDLDPYHVAMGMVSQFNESDIRAFCSGRMGQDIWHITRPIEIRYGKYIQWVPSDETIAILREGGR